VSASKIDVGFVRDMEIETLREMAEVWSSQLINLRLELKKLVNNDNLTSGELRREIRRLAEEL
jgi:hypothetical protein